MKFWIKFGIGLIVGAVFALTVMTLWIMLFV